MATKTKAKVIHAPDQLVKLFLSRQMAEQHLQLAQQTLAGATQAYIDADSRCKGVAEYLYGAEATLEFKDGKLLVYEHGNPGGKPNNGVLEITPQQLNRAARRALANKKKK